MSILQDINTPADLKTLSPGQLPQLCEELREFIITELSNNPGHLGSSLGCVELAVALHYIYNTPYDRIIWDVGHQAYAHKILTGRREQFHTNRKLGGISGFPKRSESEYDAFGGGHSSVSISAALGMDVSARLNDEERHVVAVIGDGAMTGGLAFEGLNNAGVNANDLLVILNDNEISIDPNVGALKEYLLHISTSKRYNEIKNHIHRSLKNLPYLRRFIAKTVSAVKRSILQKSNLFESFGFRYFGPMDGHDIKMLTKVLEDMKHIKGPKLLHILTVKGKGYKPAEESQTIWHAPGRFDPDTGERVQTNKGKVRYQDVFGYTLVELAKQNPKIIGVSPAMLSGCSMTFMKQEFPDRCFDVGIAEGHAVTFSGGMAASGLLPFCNIYSSFMQRAYDNVIHDIILQGVDVVLCIDRGGLVGEDGSTHHGAFDIAYFRCIPDIVISAPMNEHELRNLMYTAQTGGHGAFVIRYPRGEGALTDWHNPFQKIEIGKSRKLREGTDLAVLTLGHVGNIASEAIQELSETVSVEHIDLRFAKPLDKEMLSNIGNRFDKIITIEDGVINGGVGSAILEFMNDSGFTPKIKRLGIPDRFILHGKVTELTHQCGYDKEGIKQTIIEMTDKNCF